MGRRAGFGGSALQGTLLFCALLFVALSFRVEGKVSKQKLFEVERKLRQLNKTPVKRIQSEDGDIIDCIDIYNQPAFDHPALKNHKIQMRLTQAPPPSVEDRKEKDSSAKTILSQIWHRSGSCLEGTVPIRRVKKSELLRAKSLEDYGRKPYLPPKANRTKTNQVIRDNRQYANINDKHIFPSDEGPNLTALDPHRSTTYLTTLGYNYIGASGGINVWNPRVEADDEFSTAQIWLMNGPRESFDSVEAGWIVNPKLFGDRRTRLFAYWTEDASHRTGCFNLVCAGFVQSSHEVALGAAMAATSSDIGAQYQISISMYMDTNTGNWWLGFGPKNITIGYWPGALFSALQHSAVIVRWGGEVYSTKTLGQKPHTTTAMGSGNFAWGLWCHACFIQHIRIRDYSLYWKYPEWEYPMADEADCYGIVSNRPQPLAEPILYFGGPGRNNFCP
ncbi:hypothetical protein Sjap_019492 [Stephania japonica]|uniref:Neprosin PEP catalytic domain-containing protein n=1 Tax=Stephania japonica TaxID=461633 RepID=A0AAP0HUS3_9MAGN